MLCGLVARNFGSYMVVFVPYSLFDRVRLELSALLRHLRAQDLL